METFPRTTMSKTKSARMQHEMDPLNRDIKAVPLKNSDDGYDGYVDYDEE